MQSILYAFFIALFNNIDNISVRIAYGLKGIKIDIYKNLLISIITFIISTLSVLMGTTLTNIINSNICDIITAILFTILGIYFIFEPYIKHKKAENYIEIITNPNDADIDDSKHIDFKEAIFLGLALNLNNVGGSIAAGMIGANAFLIGGLSTIISFLIFWLGNYISSIISNSLLYKSASFVSGIIFIILAITQLF